MAEESEAGGWWKHCAGCGDRIGIYEPVVIGPPEGVLVTSFLNLTAAARAEPWRCLHADCVTDHIAPL
jgi:hypothetical protein